MFPLDANAWIVQLRAKTPSKLTQRLLAPPRSDLATCPIVRFELTVGALKGPDPRRELPIVAALLKPIRSFPFDDATADTGAAIRADLERRGLPIGGYDYIIAATALVHGLTLVTHNSRHFANVPNLHIEDWQ